MQFLADVELPCEDCNGTRYQAKVLNVEYKGKNIHDVLQMTVKEALRFFAGQTKLLEKLAVLDEIGLGYLRLGQSATTLSGGEAQRVKSGCVVHQSLPIMAAAARPERMAPSMVAGSPVWVQSPANTRLRHAVAAPGRKAFCSGVAANVARRSLTIRNGGSSPGRP